MQRTDLPIRGAVREEHIYHIPNMTAQLAIMTHVDSIGGQMLPLKANLLCSELINDMFNAELLITFLAKTFWYQSILLVAMYFMRFDLLFAVVFKAPASSNGFNTLDIK